MGDGAAMATAGGSIGEVEERDAVGLVPLDAFPAPAFVVPAGGGEPVCNAAFRALYAPAGLRRLALDAASPTREATLAGADGEPREVMIRLSRAGGRVIGVVEDLSGRRAAERALAGSRADAESARAGLELANQKLEEAYRHAKLGYWEYAIRSGQLSWSDEAFAVHGVAPDGFEPSYDNLLAILHPDDRPRYGNMLEGVIDNPKRVYAEYRVQAGDRRTRYVSSSCAPRFDGDGRLTHVFGVVLDTSDRAEAAAALEAAKQRYEEAQRTGHLGYWEYAIHTGALTLNPQAFDIFGRTPETFEASFDNLLAIMHEEDRLRFGTMLEGVIGNSKRVYFEYRVIDPAGDVRHVTSSCAPRFDQDGRLTHVFGVMLDFTERARAQAALEAAKDRAERAYADLKSAQDSLVQSEKMASLGQLVAGVAHEINGPVGVALTTSSHLLGRTEDLRRQFAAGAITRTALSAFLDVAHEGCTLLVTNTERIASLVQTFKQVAADQTDDDRRVFYVREYIQDVLLSLSTQIGPSGHRVTLDCPVALQLESYPGALARIVTHLVRNSLLHAFRPEQRGVIRIVIRPTGDGWVEMIHSDDGVGITEADRARVFNPFFTTARHQGCVGLGLHIAYNLSTQTLGGQLTVDSRVGEGTTFTLRLPKVTPEMEEG